MSGDAPYVPQLPEHPELRELALAIESFGASAEILDSSFRVVFISTETVKLLGVSPEEANRLYGLSIIRRDTDGSDVDVMRTSRESASAWFQHNAPIMRHYLNPGDAEFAEVFGRTAKLAEETDPLDVVPRAWHDRVSFSPGLRFRRFVLGDSNQLQVRLNDDQGRFLGILWQQRGTLPESLMALLGRGDEQLFERMSRVSEPARRPAAILFADLEASGALSRRLPSRGYFELIRDLTDLIDSSVVDFDGIVGKHAGDGGSALFLAETSKARRVGDGSRGD